MKNLLLCLSFSLLASTAFAADAVVEEVVVDVASGFTWTGGYIGGFAGYVWEDFAYDDAGFLADGSEGGFIGGIYVGYNYQMANNFVLGAEADIGAGDLDFDEEELGFTDYTAVETEWNGHIRARLGYAVDRALFFVAAGAAFARVSLDDTDPDWGEDTQTHLGWTIGGGVDYAVTDNLVFRAEYLYDDLGSETFDITDNGVPSYAPDLDLTASTVRVGLAYKF
jgi:outer membrane immunogenic protein